MNREVLVIGAGVSGLSCAVRLLEAGLSVRVLTRALPAQTTSAVAAALWYPFRVEAGQRVRRWTSLGYLELERLADVDGTGVLRREGINVTLDPDEDPWEGAAGPPYRPARPDELPPGLDHGVHFETIVCDMPRYLAWLLGEVERLGGVVELGEVTSLDEVVGEHEIVVHCTGLAAREVAQDSAVYPIRGQIVRVPLGDEKRVLLDERDGRLTYVVPRTTDCVLGGTAQAHDERAEPDDEDTRGIVERCGELAPGVLDKGIDSVDVGFRPGRDEVRLEAEATPGGGLLVHNYGHGGAGVTLSWGCAQDVADRVLAHLRGAARRPG